MIEFLATVLGTACYLVGCQVGRRFAGAFALVGVGAVIVIAG